MRYAAVSPQAAILAERAAAAADHGAHGAIAAIEIAERTGSALAALRSAGDRRRDEEVPG